MKILLIHTFFSRYTRCFLTFRHLLLLALLGLFVGCGSSSKSDFNDDNAQEQLPVAVIKTTKKIAVTGTKFELDGSESYHLNAKGKKSSKNIIAYVWEPSPENRIKVKLDNKKSNKTSFLIKQHLGVEYLSFTLMVTDINGKTARATKIVELRGDSKNDPVAVINDAPRELKPADKVTLDGRKSYYRDGNDDSDQFKNIIHYEWFQKASDSIKVEAEDDDKSTFTFTVPKRFVGNSDIHLVLTVTDKYKREASKELTIKMTGGDSENPVVAVIDAPGSAHPETLVELDGSRSYYDNDNATKSKYDNVVKYQWKQDSTDTKLVALTVDPTNPALVTFTSPALEGAEKLDLHFTLTVTDIHRRTNSQSITIRVSDNILYTVSGKITVKSNSHVDGDINNPRAIYTPNDTFDTAQYITNPAQVLGYINRKGKGVAGRSSKKGDRGDFYKIKITQGQNLLVQYFVGNMEAVDLPKPEEEIENITGVNLNEEEKRPQVLRKTDNNFDLYIYNSERRLETRFDTLNYCRFKEVKDCAVLGESVLIGKTIADKNFIESFDNVDGKKYHRLSAIYNFADHDLSAGEYYVQIFAGLGASNYKLTVINPDGNFEDVPKALPFPMLDVILFDPYDDLIVNPRRLYFNQAVVEDKQGNTIKGEYYYQLRDVAAAKYYMLAAIDLDNDGYYAPFLLEPAATPPNQKYHQIDLEQNIDDLNFKLEISK